MELGQGFKKGSYHIESPISGKSRKKAKSIMHSEVSRFTQEPKISYEEDKIDAGPLGRVRIAEEKQQEAEEKKLDIAKQIELRQIIQKRDLTHCEISPKIKTKRTEQQIEIIEDNQQTFSVNVREQRNNPMVIEGEKTQEQNLNEKHKVAIITETFKFF